MTTTTKKPNHKTSTANRRASPRKKSRIPPEKVASSAAQAKRSKTDQCLELLRKADGASVADFMNATGWQAHSVRGFLSGTIRKKLGLDLQSSKAEGEARRYYVEG